LTEGVEGLLEVRECPNGLGVFALRGIRAGSVIMEIDDIVITTTPKSPPWKRWALIVGSNPRGEHVFWDEAAEGSGDYWSNFLDHSEEANVRFEIDTVKRSARLVATRRIEAGEELFLNYKEYHADNWAPG